MGNTHSVLKVTEHSNMSLRLKNNLLLLLILQKKKICYNDRAWLCVYTIKKQFITIINITEKKDML